MTKHNPNDWVEAVIAAGWGDIARTGLDALAPLGPLGAQLVWISQPLLGLFVQRDLLSGLAEALESPDGLADIRARLDADAHAEHDD